MRLREFTEQGMNEFEKFLENLDGSDAFEKPEELNSEPESRLSEIDVEVDEDRQFETRMELGKYLHEIFEQTVEDRSELLNRDGLWTWLAYLWLEQLVETDRTQVNVKEIARYVAGGGRRRYYRHYVSAPYFLISLHGEENCKLFLECYVDTHKDVLEQLVNKREILTNTSLIEIANKLYWDEEEEEVKTNAGGRNDAPGTARRLRTVVEQLRRTYDLQEMSPEQIEALLPAEFDEWTE